VELLIFNESVNQVLLVDSDRASPSFRDCLSCPRAQPRMLTNVVYFAASLTELCNQAIAKGRLARTWYSINSNKRLPHGKFLALID